MNAVLETPETNTLASDASTQKKIDINLSRNKKQDQTQNIDAATRDFDYGACKGEYWNPEDYSLLWGTPLWDEASPDQKKVLNHLYWVGYYSQIISAEIATIFFNQTCAAGLYALEDFRGVCDMLDLESSQERAHINAFKTVSEKVEEELFGQRIFTYPMRGPYVETMIFNNANRVQKIWKWLQLNAFTLLSSNNAFIACQYFTVRGLRTLSGKLVQHKLSQYYMKHPAKDAAPIPSKISYYHFMDESFHFNSSTIIGHDVVRSLPKPTAFESTVANLGLRGTQYDHSHFQPVVKGIFWYGPSVYPAIYKVLTSAAFGLDRAGALDLMRRCFTEENEGIHAACETHRTAQEHYRAYMEKLDYVWRINKDMAVMAGSTLETHLADARRRFESFAAAVA